MFVCAQSPESILPEELDAYLAHGWFRMGQTIFTTQFLCFQNQLYNAIWLRVDLACWKNDAQQHKLFKKNQCFRTEIQKATYSEKHAALFQQYKQGVAFDGSASLHQLLFSESTTNIYNTYEVNVYDGDQLIACGIFDMGNESAAGISCFYHHAYKKYSLGKWLIYLKMQYCQEVGIKFFYPGYFVPGYKAFDYKLDIGKAALHFWHLATQAWQPITEANLPTSPLNEMREKLWLLQQTFANDGRESHLLRYEFFDANLVPHLQGSDLFDYPIFLTPFDSVEDLIYPLVVYNIFTACYELLQVRSVWVTHSPFADVDVYSSHVLKVDKIIFSSPEAREVVLLMNMVGAEK